MSRTERALALTLTVGFVALAVIGSTSTPCAAGAWSQPKGHYYAKLSGILYSSDEVFDDMGMRQRMGMDGDSFDGSQGFLYGEYGLADRLTVIGQTNAGVLVSENTLVRKETTGIGDFDIGAKYQLLNGPVVLSPFLTFKIPTGYDGDYDPPWARVSWMPSSGCWRPVPSTRCRCTSV